MTNKKTEGTVSLVETDLTTTFKNSNTTFERTFPIIAVHTEKGIGLFLIGSTRLGEKPNITRLYGTKSGVTLVDHTPESIVARMRDHAKSGGWKQVWEKGYRATFTLEVTKDEDILISYDQPFEIEQGKDSEGTQKPPKFNKYATNKVARCSISDLENSLKTTMPSSQVNLDNLNDLLEPWIEQGSDIATEF